MRKETSGWWVLHHDRRRIKDKIWENSDSFRPYETVMMKKKITTMCFDLDMVLKYIITLICIGSVAQW